MRQYWTVERQTDDERYDWIDDEEIDDDYKPEPLYRVQGAAGERVLLYTDRWLPLEELNVVAQALNAMPEYGGM